MKRSSKGNGGAWLIAGLIGIGVAYAVKENRKRRADAGLPAHIDGLGFWGIGKKVKKVGRKIATKVRTSKATPIVLTALGVAAGAAITVFTAGAGAPVGAAVAAAGAGAGTALKNKQEGKAAHHAAKQEEKQAILQLAEQRQAQEEQAVYDVEHRGLVGDLDEVVRGWGLGSAEDDGDDAAPWNGID